VSVNVSSRQLKASELANSVHAALEGSGLPASALDLEITERMLVDDEPEVQALFQQLAERGVRFSIDDFGTGYSSLAYLKRYAFDHLKIPDLFVRDVIRDPGDAALVRAIAALARNLDVAVIAEGVETSEQVDFLRTAGCDRAQGHYFSPPLPPTEIPRYGRAFG